MGHRQIVGGGTKCYEDYIRDLVTRLVCQSSICCAAHS